jgi:HSP20 family molecular chaperone IbpA
MPLPQGVNENDIKASFEESVLQVTAEGGTSEIEEQPKRIEIEE